MLGNASACSSGQALKSLRCVLSAGVALAVIAGFAVPADAATPRKVRHVNSKSAKAEKPKYPFGQRLTGQLQIVVSIANQHLTLYHDGVKIAQAPVSTGVPGHLTPMGVFSVIEKDRYHHSNLYSNAPMPFMHRITWSGVAIHEGPLPGHPASHGCIRTTHDFISRLWQVSKLGVRVIVSRTEVAPHEFSHPLLFNPAQKPAAPTPAASNEFDGLRSSFTQLGKAYQAPKVRLAAATSVKSDAQPIEVQQTQAPTLDATPGQVAPPAPADVDTTASTTAPDAKAPDSSATSGETPTPAKETAETQSTPANTVNTVVVDPPIPSADPVEMPRPVPLKKSADLPKYRGHVAVYVSRRDMKIYVRQGFVPLFDMPVQIANPKEPLGIHVFTALGLTDDGTKMRWNAITMPAPAHVVEHSRRTKRSGRRHEAEPEVVSTNLPTASEALDRITIPPEAIARISEIITPGSSLVVSDQGLGRETGRYTDFIVETH